MSLANPKRRRRDETHSAIDLEAVTLRVGAFCGGGRATHLEKKRKTIFKGEFREATHKPVVLETKRL